MILLNPKTETFAHLDPKSREIMKKVVDYFESRGKAKLKSDSHERIWYDDFIQFLKANKIFATTLQALYAIYDNCNSLHTNAYDEAVTTPSEESVRRSLAIQMIINKELGQAKNENVNQGSFYIEQLTDLVEEAVLAEFDRITARGGVKGAMERGYQRSRIQDESLHYEQLKHSGELPLVGVNMFLNPNADETDAISKLELARATEAEKQSQLDRRAAFVAQNNDKSPEALARLKQVALAGENIFAELMETVRCCTLGQITGALYEVGGKYRRNM
jgi:methylmalonyl-CoA mutase